MIIGFPQANFDPRLFLFGTGLKTATRDRLDPVSRQADACSMQGLRRALVHIALAALILRAFLPAGWMPNPKGPAQSAFVICTMDGPVIGTNGKAQPGKDDPRAHESCPFAASAQLAPPVDFIALAAPQLSTTAAPRDLAAGFVARRSPFLPPASRAPPSLT
jgi:hypothetical protein